MSPPNSQSRRSFLVSLSGLLTAELALATPSRAQERAETQILPTELSPEERILVSESRMAREVLGYFNEGYSCAEAMLVVSLRKLDKPEALVWAAAGFGGGLGRRDLCGFLTGGAMGIGLAAGELNLEREEAKDRCSRALRSLWEWWDLQAPPKCEDIRTPGTPGTVCARLGQLASARVESLIDQMQA